MITILKEKMSYEDGSKKHVILKLQRDQSEKNQSETDAKIWKTM